MAFSAPPLMASGARLPWLRPRMRAPMRVSGSTTRFMGRLRRYWSPVTTEKNDCPASRPVIRRMVVPELPQSITSPGSLRPCSPLPRMTTVSPSSAISTPMERKAPMVAILSPPRRKPRTVVVPLAMAPSMIERCEMDLSPGTVISPLTDAAGLMVMVVTGTPKRYVLN